MKTQNSIMKHSTIKFSRTLALLLGVSALPLSMCKAQTTVFQDFSSGDTSGANIVGSTPIVGTTWTGDNGGQLLTYGSSSGKPTGQATPYSIYTDGAGRTIYGGFTSALGTGQELTLSFNGLGFGGGWPSSGGYAGVSLYAGYTGTAGSGNEREFIGEPFNSNQWGLDNFISGPQN